MPLVPSDAALSAATGWFGWRRSKDDQLRVLAHPYLIATGSALRRLRKLSGSRVVDLKVAAKELVLADTAAEARGEPLPDGFKLAVAVDAVDREELARANEWLDIAAAYFHPDVLFLAQLILLGELEAVTRILQAAGAGSRQERSTELLSAARALNVAETLLDLFTDSLRRGAYYDTWNLLKRRSRRNQLRKTLNRGRDAARALGTEVSEGLAQDDRASQKAVAGEIANANTQIAQRRKSSQPPE